jgi:inorganic pyrophosphatase
MQFTNLLQQGEKFAIQEYERPQDVQELRRTHVPFSGSPLRHPYDDEKIILVADPYSTHTFYYEFRTDDISWAEKLPSLVNVEGESVSMVRVWVRKRSVGVRHTPFIVEDIGEEW